MVNKLNYDEMSREELVEALKVAKSHRRPKPTPKYKVGDKVFYVRFSDAGEVVGHFLASKYEVGTCTIMEVNYLSKERTYEYVANSSLFTDGYVTRRESALFSTEEEASDYGKEKVTAENLRLTRIYLGDKACDLYRHCKLLPSESFTDLEQEIYTAFITERISAVPSILSNLFEYIRRDMHALSEAPVLNGNKVELLYYLSVKTRNYLNEVASANSLITNWGLTQSLFEVPKEVSEAKDYFNELWSKLLIK